MPNDPMSGRSLPPQRFSPVGTESPSERDPPRRRGSSFSFLRRTKSGSQLRGAKSPLSGRLSKKYRGASKEQEMNREPISSVPPRIPDIPHPTQLQTFGGENAKPVLAGPGSSRIEISPANNVGFKMYSNVPIPPVPGLIHDRRGEYADPSGRTDSMTHRGRYSYASSVISSANNSRRVRRRRDLTPFKYVRAPFVFRASCR